MARDMRHILGMSSRELRGVLVILTAALTALVIIGMPQSRTGTSSVEVRFADMSPKGMAIVPASCPSSPHDGSFGCSSCVAGYYCSGSVRYYRSATCAQNFVETCEYGCSNGMCLERANCASGDTSCLGQCTPQYFCFGADQYYRSSQCDDSFIQKCFYGCTLGECNIAPAGTLNIQVSPALVRTGTPTTVSWTSSGMSSCTVTEDNPTISDTWGESTGSQQSSPITQRTTYTLTCFDEDNKVYTDTATVNILFVFEEQ